MTRTKLEIIIKETLSGLARNGNARIYIGFDKHTATNVTNEHD